MLNHALGGQKTGRTQKRVSHETVFGVRIRSGGGGSERTDTLTQSNYYTSLRGCGSWARNPGLAHTVPENRDEPGVDVCFDRCPELPP